MGPRAGVTLVELMVTVVILAVVGVSILGALTYIARAIQTHRARTLAFNLSQEQVEVLKNKSYFALLPTPTPSYDTNFSPSLPYDPTYYPAETVRIGVNTFTRLTYVERVLNSSGTLVNVPYDSLDTGLKRITIHTIWKLGNSWYKSTVTNLASNYTQLTTGGFSGTVTNTGGSPVAEANVFIQEDAYLHDYTDASGNYAFAVSPGVYTLVASAPGYQRKTLAGTYTATSGNMVDADFVLTAIASGTVTGTVYYTPSIVISQVVAATNTICDDGASHDVEYIELFNPTTYPINVSQNLHVNQYLSFAYYDETSGSNKTDAQFNFTYVSTYIAPGRSFLLANATYFYVAGGWVTADAYYGTLYANYIRNDKAGAIRVARASDDTKLDKLGWDDSNNASPDYEGTYFDTPVDGLTIGNQLVRMSSPGVVSATYGKAYDTNYNNVDFVFSALAYAPRTTVSAAQTIVAGTPAYGAVVTVNDGASAAGYASLATVGGYSVASFSVGGISTGTWSVDIAHEGASATIASVAVLTQGAVTAVPNAATSLAWVIANDTSTILRAGASTGIVSGRVTTGAGAALAGITVTVEPAASGVTDASGNYAVTVPAGTYSVIANPSSLSAPSYGSSSLSSVAVGAGEYNSGNDLILSGAGRIIGYVCSYSVANPLPGISVTASDASSNVRGQAVSGSDGTFFIPNLSTGAYTVEAVLDTGQSAAEGTVAATVATGSDVSIGTFTITGAFVTVTGTVTASGAPITTGVLLVVTTATIAGALPPYMSTAILNGAPYYMASSRSDGTFTLEVRTGTGVSTLDYNVYGWYTTYPGGVPTPSKQNTTITVTGGVSATTGLAW